MDVCLEPAVALAEKIRKHEIGSRELLEAYLARVERLNPAINAVVTLDADRARSEADAADAALSRGDTTGPLHGLPITVKDTFEREGVRTTAGAEMFSDHVSSVDAVSVARLRAAGAIVFGKTNTPVFAGDVQTYNPVFGTTNNPWNPERACGGSSGGSAAAMAAGLSALELGSDIGGSIRNPAHFNGVYGHKPTFGILPIRGHIPGAPGMLGELDLAVCGPIARSAADLSAALDLLAGPLEDRAVAWKLGLPPPRRKTLRDYKVALWLDDPAFPVDVSVRTLFEGAADALRKAGATVEEARPEIDFASADRAYRKLLWPPMSLGMTPEQVAEMETLAASDATGELAEFARAVVLRQRDWIVIDEERQILRARWADLFRKYDVLLCPITPTAAIPHDHSEPMLARRITVNGEERPYLDQIAWAGIVTMAYLPATVAPVGLTGDGLPVGIQIVGPYLEDRTSIDFAGRLEQVVGGYEPPPAAA